MNLIADREICVCYLVEILRISQPKVSRHLAYLRRAGIVASRREGKWMHYRLRMPADEQAAVLREVLRRLAAIPAMRRDGSRLTSACCTHKTCRCRRRRRNRAERQSAISGERNIPERSRRWRTAPFPADCPPKR